MYKRKSSHLDRTIENFKLKQLAWQKEQPRTKRYFRVAVKDELKPKLPFKEMKSRLATVEILAFTDFDYNICPVMQ